MSNQKTAVVAGIGSGLGLSLCKKLLAKGYQVAGLSRSVYRGESLGDAFLSLVCDVSNKKSVDTAISEVEQHFGEVSVYIHNAASLHMGTFLETQTESFESQWQVTFLGAVHGAQRVLPAMLNAGEGTIIMTGATASVKAGNGFSAFSSAKFALRGLTQSLAREFGPQGIHIAHVLVDGLIWGDQAENKFSADKNLCLLPNEIAETYLHLIEQHRSAWTQELDIRPDTENF